MAGNTLLVTGGGTGIGRGLALAFAERGNRVVVAGRRRAPLEATASAHPAIQAMALDVGSADDVRAGAERLGREVPELDAVVHAAGIMRPEDLRAGATADAEETLAINVLGTIRLTAALLPRLLARPRATVMTVSSGLAFVPRASTPTYSASKAAIHSYTQSLRYQLRDTAVQVIELVPPYVQTELTGAHQATDPRAMPLAAYLAETMQRLEADPGASEILVDRVLPQRTAERSGDYVGFYRRMNDALEAAATRV